MQAENKRIIHSRDDPVVILDFKQIKTWDHQKTLWDSRNDEVWAKTPDSMLLFCEKIKLSRTLAWTLNRDISVTNVTCFVRLARLKFQQSNKCQVDVSKWGTISSPEFVGDTSLGWTHFFLATLPFFCKLGHFCWTSEHSNCKCFNEDLSSAIEEVWPSCYFFWRNLVSSHSEPKCCRTLNLSVTTFWIKVSHSSLPCARHLLWHLVCDILATSRVRHSGFRVSRLATINCVTLFIFVLVCLVLSYFFYQALWGGIFILICSFKVLV